MNNVRKNIIIFLGLIVVIVFLFQVDKLYTIKTDTFDNETIDLTQTGIDVEKKDEIMDTETWALPEIIVDEEYIDMLPKVEEVYDKSEINVEENSEELPEEINLNIQFYAQAPDWNWIQPWKDACEESSLALSYHFIHGDTITKEDFKSDILEMVDLQNEIFGSYVDTSIEQTAQLLEEYYDYHDYEILENPSIMDLKQELALWHPIIAPFAGKKLWNSYFTNGGPRYHMLVIKWYNENFFITNDVWTSRGENFAYSQEIIMDSMHDLIPNGEGNIEDWEKRVLVIK